jgi:hypothetical protein
MVLLDWIGNFPDSYCTQEIAPLTTISINLTIKSSFLVALSLCSIVLMIIQESLNYFHSRFKFNFINVIISFFMLELFLVLLKTMIYDSFISDSELM